MLTDASPLVPEARPTGRFRQQRGRGDLPGQPRSAGGVPRVGEGARQSRPDGVTGIVLDNSNQPIEGVTMRDVSHAPNTGLPEEVVTAVETDALGFFNILPAPVGSFKLMADGATALNGPWPTLEFDIVTVAGRATDVGLPIYLPKLDGLNTLCVDETTGGTLTLPAVPGFALTVAAGRRRSRAARAAAA